MPKNYLPGQKKRCEGQCCGPLAQVKTEICLDTSQGAPELILCMLIQAKFRAGFCCWSTTCTMEILTFCFVFLRSRVES